MRKVITLVTVVAFICFSYSCASYKYYHSEKEYSDSHNTFVYIDWEQLKKEEASIISLESVSGKRLDFLESGRGHIKDGFVVGKLKIKDKEKRVKISLEKIKWIKVDDETSYNILIGAGVLGTLIWFFASIFS